MNLRQAAEQALEALEEIGDEWGFTSERTVPNRTKAIQELRQALAQSVDAVNMSQERVDETDKFNHITVVCHKDHDKGYEDYVGKCLLCEVERLQKREWVGLTDEESKPLIQKAMMYYGHNPDHWALTAGAGFCALAKAIEAKLKEKNNG
jgi:hypothetical protein